MDIGKRNFARSDHYAPRDESLTTLSNPSSVHEEGVRQMGYCALAVTVGSPRQLKTRLL